MTHPAQAAYAIILLAHGSRDALWRQPIEAVAARVQMRAPDVAVRCAYLESTQPNLEQAVDELIAHGVTQVTVFPLFLGMGKHARADVPSLVAALRQRHPHVQMQLKTSVGENDRLLDLLADIALEHD